MEDDEFKQRILEILWDGKHMNRFVCELRLTLFVNALKVADERPDCLYPFPFYFFNHETKAQDKTLLREHIESIPALDGIKEGTELPQLTWQLLYWIFTNPLTISALHLKEPNPVFVRRLVEETKLVDIPIANPDRMIHFKIETKTPKGEISETFLEGKKKFGTFFAFHGSKFENFHSIIHRGLVSALNQRSAYGFGTYLTFNYRTAMGYATNSNIWPHSKLLSSPIGVKCVGIVEVVDDPSIYWPNLVKSANSDLWTQRKLCFCCVVNRDELMQLRYLLLSY